MKRTFFLITLFCCSITLQALSIQEKVGQVLMVHFYGETANQDARTLIQDLHVGAIIYYNWCNGLHNPDQVKSLSTNLQSLAKTIPLFIAVDQEGGRVQRLTQGFTLIPTNLSVGQSGDPASAKKHALTIAKELLAVGINMNLAPVVDVNSNPDNPVIGNRSFSNDPRVVTQFAQHALEGYDEGGVVAVLKHFPGHGDVTIDSHADLPVIRKSMNELESVELHPFAHLAAHADVIMTAHLLVPALDAKQCSTLSKPTLDYLRNVIGFNGIIISDSLVMEGVLKQCGTVEEAAIQALAAGCDMLILGGKQLIGKNDSLELSVEDVRSIHTAICRAVAEGRISEKRLNEAVEKILKLKKEKSAEADASAQSELIISRSIGC